MEQKQRIVVAEPVVLEMLKAAFVGGMKVGREHAEILDEKTIEIAGTAYVNELVRQIWGQK